MPSPGDFNVLGLSSEQTDIRNMCCLSGTQQTLESFQVWQTLSQAQDNDGGPCARVKILPAVAMGLRHEGNP